MIRISVILIFCIVSATAFAQQADTLKLKSVSNPRIVHIATSAYTRPDSVKLDSVGLKAESMDLNMEGTELFCLSLVSADMYSNFKRDIRKIASNPSYNSQWILVAVAKKDDTQKTRFMLEFYKNWLSAGDFQLSYKKTVRDIKREYKVLDFKTKLIRKKN